MTTKPRIKLSELVNAIETAAPEISAYLDREYGCVVFVTDDDMAAVEDDQEEEGVPDWQKEALGVARHVADDDGTRFLALPTQFDVHQWEMMAAFAKTVTQGPATSLLANTIHGSGAFRRFNDVVHATGLTDRWYAFRDKRYREIAKTWCEENGVEVVEDGLDRA